MFSMVAAVRVPTGGTHQPTVSTPQLTPVTVVVAHAQAMRIPESVVRVALELLFSELRRTLQITR
jgi:hypothetical protein